MTDLHVHGEPGTNPYRRELAKELSRAIIAKYGEAILGVAVYGSVAFGTDTPHSDLEMVSVTTDIVSEHGAEYVHASGQKVDIAYAPASRFLRRARTVDGDWPIVAPVYYRQLVLFQREGVFARSRDALRRLTDADFAEGQARCMREDVYEEIGKVRSAHDRGATENMLWAARDLAFASARCLAIANRTYFSSLATMWSELRALPALPPRLEEIIAVLSGARHADVETVYREAEALWEGVREIVERQGIAWLSDEWRID